MPCKVVCVPQARLQRPVPQARGSQAGRVGAACSPQPCPRMRYSRRGRAAAAEADTLPAALKRHSGPAAHAHLLMSLSITTSWSARAREMAIVQARGAVGPWKQLVPSGGAEARLREQASGGRREQLPLQVRGRSNLRGARRTRPPAGPVMPAKRALCGWRPAS